MALHGYYLVNEDTDELWEVTYDRKNYSTLDTPSIRRSRMTLEAVKKYGFTIKTFKDVISLIPYPQLP